MSTVFELYASCDEMIKNSPCKVGLSREKLHILLKLFLFDISNKYSNIININNLILLACTAILYSTKNIK